MGETMQTGKRIYSDRHGVMKRHTVSRIDRRRYICNIVSDCWHKRISIFRWNLAYPLPPLLRLKTPFTWHHYYEHKWQLMFTLIWIWRAYITLISLLSVPTMCFTSFWESNISTHRRLPSFLLFDAKCFIVSFIKKLLRNNDTLWYSEFNTLWSMATDTRVHIVLCKGILMTTPSTTALTNDDFALVRPCGIHLLVASQLILKLPFCINKFESYIYSNFYHIQKRQLSYNVLSGSPRHDKAI